MIEEESPCRVEIAAQQSPSLHLYIVSKLIWSQPTPLPETQTFECNPFKFSQVLGSGHTSEVHFPVERFARPCFWLPNSGVDVWIQWSQALIFLCCIGGDSLNACPDNLNSFLCKSTLWEKTVCFWLNYNGWFPKENSLEKETLCWELRLHGRENPTKLSKRDCFPSQLN